MADYTLSLLMDNRPGVLLKITNLLTRRGFNIDSLTVGVVETPEKSRMTIVVQSDKFPAEQIIRQISKLSHVIDVKCLDDNHMVKRELLFVKVKVEDAHMRNEIIQIMSVFRGRVVDISTHSVTVEITGTVEKNNALLELLKEYGIQSVARTGVIALERGMFQNQPNQEGTNE